VGLRLSVVLVLLVVFAVAPVLWRRRQVRVERGPAVEPTVPASLLDGADRTWLLFTTPWCVSCGPVEERLRVVDPDTRLVKVDATQHSDVARALAVRSAPTALLADRDGQVQARLVGPEAVDRYLRVTSP
jgi:hypothetical protein